MKKVVYSVFSLVVVLMGLKILLSSSSQGRAFAAGSGNTGAPGEATVCANCHGGGAFSATSYQIQLLDNQNNVVTSYVPGTVHTLRGTFSTPTGSPTPPAYGFQVVSLVGTSTTYNAWSSPSTNARIASARNGRSYTEHIVPSSSNTFSVNWTAPAAGTGNVFFYSAANGVNLNRGTSGDNGYRSQFTISENISTDITKTTASTNLNFYPNPVKDQLFIEFNQSQVTSIELLDQSGRIVNAVSSNIQSKTSIEMNQLEGGIYFLRWQDAVGSSQVKKIIKL